jgi:hypothetical protein
MLTISVMEPTQVMACEPNAIPAKQHERWIELSRLIYGAIEEIRELPDGYAARLPNRPEMLALLAEDLNIERMCCPFLRFTIEIEPQHGPFWLRLTGREGVKDFLRIAFEGSDLFDPEVARAAGFAASRRRDVNSVAQALATVDALNSEVAVLASRR